MNQTAIRLLPIISVCLSAMLAVMSSQAHAIDWSTAKPMELQLFYPGTTSLEWIYNKRAHDGATRYKRRKKGCKGCHDGDEPEYGSNIVRGSDLESTPLTGRRGYVTMKVQAAHDGSNLHLRLQWPKAKGTLKNRQDADHDTKLTLILDDNSVEEFTAGGCWAICHVDTKTMSQGADRQKYLAESRSRMSKGDGGGDNYLSDAELQNLLNKGVFLEFWQARLNPGQPVKVVDGYILKQRSENPNTTVTATATEQDDNWVVEFSRPLTGGSNLKPITAGKTFTVGAALHDQFTAGRFHLASLQFTLSLTNDDAELLVVKQ